MADAVCVIVMYLIFQSAAFPMNEDNRKKAPRGARVPVDLDEVARHIEKGRVLTEEAARIIVELDELAAVIEAQLRRPRIVRVPRPRSD